MRTTYDKLSIDPNKVVKRLSNFRYLLNHKGIVAAPLIGFGTVGASSAESSGGPKRFSKSKGLLSASWDHNSSPEHCDVKKGYLSSYYDNSLCLNPRGFGGSSNLYPGDLLSFTRRPVLLVIDSDNNNALKAGGYEVTKPSKSKEKKEETLKKSDKILPCPRCKA